MSKRTFGKNPRVRVWQGQQLHLLNYPATSSCWNVALLAPAVFASQVLGTVAQSCFCSVCQGVVEEGGQRDATIGFWKMHLFFLALNRWTRWSRAEKHAKKCLQLFLSSHKVFLYWEGTHSFLFSPWVDILLQYIWKNSLRE